MSAVDAGPLPDEDAASPALSLARSRLRRAAGVAALVWFVALLVLIHYDANDDDYRATSFRVAEAWATPVSLSGPLVVGVLLLGSFAMRFLPGGRKAAQQTPFFGRDRTRWEGKRKPLTGTVVGGLLLVLLGVGVAVPLGQGLIASTGARHTFTMGQGVEVVDVKDGSRGTKIHVVDGPALPREMTVEGGDGSDGQRYGYFSDSSGSAWRIGPRGWLFLAFLLVLLVVLPLSLGVGLLRSAWRRRQENAGLRRRPAAVLADDGRGPARVLVVVTALVAVGGVAALVVHRLETRERSTTVAIGRLDQVDVDADDLEYAEPGAQQAVRVDGDGPRVPGSDPEVDPVRYHGTVTRYRDEASARAAAAAQLDYLRSVYKGSGLVLSDGTRAVHATDDDPSSFNATNVVLVRGRVVLELSFDTVGFERTLAEQSDQVVREAPAVIAELSSHADEIVDVDFPWYL